MLTELAALLDLLKSKGVATYEGPGTAQRDGSFVSGGATYWLTVSRGWAVEQAP